MVVPTRRISSAPLVEFERSSFEDTAVQYRIVRSGLDDLKGLTDNESVVQDGSDWSFTTTTDSSDAAEPDTSITPGVHTSRSREPGVQTTSVGPHSLVSNRGSEDESPAAPHFVECDGDPQWSAHAALLLDAAMENRFIPPHVVSSSAYTSTPVPVFPTPDRTAFCSVHSRETQHCEVFLGTLPQ